MDFAKPNYLYLLILVPVAIVFLLWADRQRRWALARLGEPTLIAMLSANISQRKRRWKAVLVCMSLVSLAVALARPRWGTQVTVNVQQGVEVIVVLDVSSSMLAEDIKPNRLTRAKLTVEELMDRLGGNEVGLVIFSGAAFVQFPLTADFYTARSFLYSTGPDSISRPGTALEEAIRVALNGFPEEHATSRVILLLTDGEGHEGDPLAVAQEAAEQGVIIHAIGFGSPTGEPIPIRDSQGNVVEYKQDAQGETVLSKLDEVILQRVATATDGYYFRASATGEEVTQIINAIDMLATGESEEEGQFETQGVERFAWFAGAALIALTADTVLGERKQQR
ncbi:MAG: VWA domain-containing protein [Anaerolineae bacterium]|nr:VWA domain-containing protein [Anaerolineae bacterium]